MPERTERISGRRTETVRTLVVDDHRAFLLVAADVIRATPGFESVGETGSAAEALAIVADRRPELALIDVQMPGMDGVELTRRIKDTSTGTAVLLISAEDVGYLSSATARCGADGYLSKQRFGPAALRGAWATLTSEGAAREPG